MDLPTRRLLPFNILFLCFSDSSSERTLRQIVSLLLLLFMPRYGWHVANQRLDRRSMFCLTIGLFTNAEQSRFGVATRMALLFPRFARWSTPFRRQALYCDLASSTAYSLITTFISGLMLKYCA